MIFAFLLVVAADASQTAQATTEGAPSPTAVASATPAPIQSGDGFQVGVDTYATIIAKLGKPNSTSAMSDGTKIIVYVSNHAHVKAKSFIPVVGLFSSGSKGSMSIKTFTFSSDGLLKSFTSNDSNSNCDFGIAGGGCH